MSDLISREALLADLEHGKSVCKGLVELSFFDAIIVMVNKQPTAYDVEKVAEIIQHKAWSVNAMAMPRYESGKRDAYYDALEVVKAGGKE